MAMAKQWRHQFGKETLSQSRETQKILPKAGVLKRFWEDSCVTRKQLIDQQKSTNRPTGVLLPPFSWLNWWPIMLSLKVIETLHSSQTWHQPPRSPIPWKNPTNGDLITRNKRNKYNFMGPYLHAPENKKNEQQYWILIPSTYINIM